jgi:transposase-like protein
MSRSRLDDSEKLEWVELFESYDLSAAAFCREFDLPYSSFLSWRRLAAEGKSKARAKVPGTDFVELVVQQPHGAAFRPQVPKVIPIAELALGSDVVFRLFAPSHRQS